jgi:hypothetical protein
VRFIGANADATALCSSKLPGIVNYLRGADPGKWITGVPTYARVRLRGVWPGVDVVYYRAGPDGTAFEQDYVVAPGGNVGSIRFVIEGASAVRIEGGNLVAAFGHGAVHWRRPTAYQIVGGRRMPVGASFVLDRGVGSGRPENPPVVSFRVAPYDHARPLTIDPVLVYCTYVGGAADDRLNGIAVDGAGAAYVTGQTSSTDYPVTGGAWDTTLDGSWTDCVVTKVAPDGATLQYSTYLGGTTSDSGAAIAVDDAGNAYVHGGTGSADFPTTAGAAQPTFPNVYGSSFVTKLNPTGSGLVYSTFFGGGHSTYGTGIAVDENGAAFITGNTWGQVPTTPGAFDETLNGNLDAYVCKVHPTGGSYLYCTVLGGSDNDWCYSIALSGQQAYVTGKTRSPDFPLTPGAFETVGGATDTVFVTGFNADGTALVCSTYVGPGVGLGIAADADGYSYVTGEAQTAAYPTTVGAYDTAWDGLGEAFVTKVNPTGTGLAYSTFLGGSTSSEIGYAIALWQTRACVTGYTNSADFPVTPDALQPIAAGNNDAFVTVLDAAGSALDFSTYYGGRQGDWGTCIATRGDGRLFVAGYTYSDDMLTHSALEWRGGRLGRVHGPPRRPRRDDPLRFRSDRHGHGAGDAERVSPPPLGSLMAPGPRGQVQRRRHLRWKRHDRRGGAGNLHLDDCRRPCEPHHPRGLPRRRGLHRLVRHGHAYLPDMGNQAGDVRPDGEDHRPDGAQVQAPSQRQCPAL